MTQEQTRYYAHCVRTGDDISTKLLTVAESKQLLERLESVHHEAVTTKVMQYEIGPRPHGNNQAGGHSPRNR